MLRSIDLPSLIKEIKSLSDQKGSEFQNNEEITNRIDDVFSELYNGLIELNEGFFLETSEVLTPENRNELPFPANFYKLKLLNQYIDEENKIPIQRRSLREVSQYSGNIYYYENYYPCAYGYVLFSKMLKLYPIDSVSSYKFQMEYYPEAPDIQEAEMEKTFEKYLKYQTAWLIGMIAQNPNAELEKMAMKFRSSIMQWASNRDDSLQMIQNVAPGPDFELNY